MRGFYQRPSDERRHDEILRRMAEPEDVRELRRQADAIESERQRTARRFMYDLEAARLRQQIRDAGEVPCR